MLIKRTLILLLAALLLGACSKADEADELVERVGDERPEYPIIATPRRASSPTPIATLIHTPPRPTALPSATSIASPISESGPWLLYCNSNGEAVLMDLSGENRQAFRDRCIIPPHLSAGEGLAVENEDLLQFPGGEGVRVLGASPFEWSADGSALVFDFQGFVDDVTEMLVYKPADDRLLPILESGFGIDPMGISPDGHWIVYLEWDSDRQNYPFRDPPASVMAVTSDGSESQELYGVYDADIVANSVAGWLSEESLLVRRRHNFCGIELLHVDLSTGSTRHIFREHEYLALDPSTDTLLVSSNPPGGCGNGTGDPSLVRMSAARNWIPQSIQMPVWWSSDWAITFIQWHPELDLFSVVARESCCGERLRLITMTSEGTIVNEFPLNGARVVTSARFLPSPDGQWIVVGASEPYGTRLYSADGELVSELITEDLIHGPWQVAWTPDSEAFFVVPYEGQRIYRAAISTGWDPLIVESSAEYASNLSIVHGPRQPYRAVCDGSMYTRLDVGSRVAVNTDPPLAIRLWGGAGPGNSPVGRMEPGDEAKIVDGPYCGNEVLWWQLEHADTGLIGWTEEHNSQWAWLLLAD